MINIHYTPNMKSIIYIVLLDKIMDKFQTISWRKFYKLAVHNLIFPRRKNGFILNTFKLVIVFCFVTSALHFN